MSPDYTDIEEPNRLAWVFMPIAILMAAMLKVAALCYWPLRQDGEK